jgi:prophage antirepressor-like protein
MGNIINFTPEGKEEVSTFTFEGYQIRVVQIDDEPWFVAKDVCDALELTNPSMALGMLGDDERSKFNLGRQGKVNVINEAGLYTLILRCKGAVTEGTISYRFRKYVTGEVLPSIRKTGEFKAQPKLPPHFQAIQDLVLQAAEQERRLTKVEDKLSEFDSDTGYMTVSAYARKINKAMPLSVANSFGRKAAQLCKQRGLSVGSIPDERFGRVNSYPISILDEVAEDFFDGEAA